MSLEKRKKRKKEEKKMNNIELIPIKEVILESDPERGNMVILKEHPDAERYFLMFKKKLFKI